MQYQQDQQGTRHSDKGSDNPFSLDNGPLLIIVAIAIGAVVLKMFFNSSGFNMADHPYLESLLELAGKTWFLAVLYFGCCYALAQKTETVALSATLVMWGIIGILLLCLMNAAGVWWEQAWGQFTSSVDFRV